MRLYYPDAETKQFVNIPEPTLEQLQTVLASLKPEIQSELMLYIDDTANWILQVAIDDEGQRFLVKYKEPTPQSRFYKVHCAIDATLASYDPSDDSIKFTASNGEAHTAGLHETLPLPLAVRVTSSIYETRTAPDWVEWKLHMF